tara:strand:- start:273992 stop:277405 length:3414 start_codon:yes stop_codon:yes gene_type:complete
MKLVTAFRRHTMRPGFRSGARRAAEVRREAENRRGGETRRRRLSVQQLENRRVLAAYVVNTAVDVVDEGDNVISLREAIALANESAAADTITFDETVFASPTEIDLLFGELSISNPLELVGPGPGQLTIDAQNASRVVNIVALSGDVTIKGLTLTGGRTSDDNVESEGVTETTYSGAGVRFVTDGTLTMMDTVITGNETTGVSATGGGLFADRGTVNVIDSVISMNRTRGLSAFGGGVSTSGAVVTLSGSQVVDNVTSGVFADGGGVHMRLGTVTIEESLVSGNLTSSAQAYGGGLYLDGGATTIRRSTITDNSANGIGSIGGGIAINGDLELINSTIHNNSADGSTGMGGGIAAIQGDLHVVHSTITGNSAALGIGGGIAVVEDSMASLSLLNSIVAENTDDGTAPDFSPPSDAGLFTIAGTLVGDATGTPLTESQTADAMGNIVGAPAPGGGLLDPMLGNLADNGGPTPTRLPLAGSLAIDSGRNDLSVDSDANALLNDQRGALFHRNSNSIGEAGIVDRGAVEVQPPPTVPIHWNAPGPILIGSELTTTQLDATAPVDGTFVYTPPLGTVLDEGDGQTLNVQFTPDDNVNYSISNASVTIDVVPPLDFGDAPDTYGTTRGGDGARHADGTLRLGATIVLEADGQPSETADADSGDDGVIQIAPMIANPLTATTTGFLVNVSAASKLDGWIDFNRDGTFDHPSEHIGGGTSLDLVIRDNVISVSVPVGSEAGETYARFRVSTTGGLLPTGLASDGEVEDFVIQIVDGDSPQDVAITLPSGTATLAADGNQLAIRLGETEVFRAPVASISRYDITGADSSDVLVIDHTAGDPLPAGGMRYDGGDRVNTVRLVGDSVKLDVSTDGNVELENIDVVDLGIDNELGLVIDRPSLDAIDPDGGGLVVTGGTGDRIDLLDAELWRMGEPLVVAGFFFTRIETGLKFIQTDLPTAWHNYVRPSDVNGDGEVSVGDALRVINELKLRRFSDPDTDLMDDPASFDPFPGVYPDHNADGRTSPLDALRVINELSRQGTGEGEDAAKPAVDTLDRRSVGYLDPTLPDSTGSNDRDSALLADRTLRRRADQRTGDPSDFSSTASKPTGALLHDAIELDTDENTGAHSDVAHNIAIDHSLLQLMFDPS